MNADVPPPQASFRSGPELASGTSIPNLVELLSESILGELLPDSGDYGQRAHGVVVATSLPIGSGAKGKVVIYLGPVLSDIEKVLFDAGTAGAALLILSSAEKRVGFDQRPSDWVPAVWLDQDADWVEIIALCRSATAEGVAETALGIPVGDIFAVADTLATLSGGAVSIVDTVGRVLGYSTLPGQEIDELRRRTTLTLQEDVSPDKDSDFAVVYSSGKALMMPAPAADSYGRVVIAVRYRGEVLGTIWVIQPPGGRAESITEVLETMEPMVSQHLLRTRFFGRRQVERTTDLVRSLVYDSDNVVVATRYLGLSLHHQRVVVRFRFPHSQIASQVRDLHRLHHSVETHAQLSFPRAVVALIDTDIVAILEVAGDDAVKHVVQFGHRIVDYQRQAGAVPFIAGVGGATVELSGLGASNLQALDTLAAIETSMEQPEATRIRNTVGSFNEWRSDIGLSYIADSILSGHLWAHDQAQNVLDYDSHNETAYAETLLSFFRCRENVAATAKRLHTHHNTIRYRLGRVEPIFGIDLDDSSQRLWLWMRLEAEKR